MEFSTSKAETGTTPSCQDITGNNLIIHGDLEAGDITNNIPNNWIKRIVSDGAHYLEWVSDPDGGAKGKVLKSEFTGVVGSQIKATSWESYPIGVKKNTWYKLSVNMAYEGITPVFLENGTEKITEADMKTMSEYSSYAGLQFYVRDANGRQLNRYDNSFMWITGPTMTNWDEESGIYRTYKKDNPFSGWKEYVRYIKTPPDAVEIVLSTRNWPPGKVYFDDFFLREVEGNCDPSTPPFQKSGTLSFLKYKGNDFFPIILGGFPTKEGSNGTQSIDVADIKTYGFNTVMAGNYISYGTVLNSGEPDYVDPKINKTYKQWLEEADLAVLVANGSDSEYVYNNTTNSPDWVNDPYHKVEYVGVGNLSSYVIDKWKGFGNLLTFFYGDENNCSPYKSGSYPPNMNSYGKRYQTYRNNSSAYVSTNYGNLAYSGILLDNSYYLPYTDIAGFTWNTPEAYPYQNKYSGATIQPIMGNVGSETRKMIKMMKDSGKDLKFMAFGLGDYSWSGWNGETQFDLGRYIPFNLQRFQLFNQIINGATGAWFWGTGNDNDFDGINRSYYLYQHKQMYQLTKELKQYYDVLLESNFYDEWTTSDSRIEAMLKKHDDKIYLFTASTAYEDITNVTITLDINSEYKINTITALNDVENGDISNPIARREIIPESTNSFQDDFIGEDASAPQGEAASGYAVHVYEITLSKINSAFSPPQSLVVK